MSLALNKTLKENYILSTPALPGLICPFFDCVDSLFAIFFEQSSKPLLNSAFS